MNKHKRLKLNEREQLFKLSVQTYTQNQLAKMIGCSQSTISRELRRCGMDRSTYSVSHAQVNRNNNVSKNGRKKKLHNNSKLEKWIKRCIIEWHWSPEQTSNVLKKQSKSTRRTVSHETIYKYIYSIEDNSEREEWIKSLRRKRKKRRPRLYINGKRGPVKGGVSIHNRPPHVENRQEVGHWEGDLIIGKDHKSALGTCVERKTRYTLIIPLYDGRTSDVVVKAFENRLQKLPNDLRKTLTYDNGAEMALHYNLKSSLGIDVYFADPGCPGQRGTNENTNGLIREFFPKGTNFLKIPEETFSKVERLLNQRPRKVLGYNTPEKLLREEEEEEPPDKHRFRAGKKAAVTLS